MDRIVSIDHIAGSARDENVRCGAAASPARGAGALRARRPPAPLRAGAAGRQGLLPRRLSRAEPPRRGLRSSRRAYPAQKWAIAPTVHTAAATHTIRNSTSTPVPVALSVCTL